VFASRAPHRPNGLGLSLVRVLSLEPGAIRVAGIDAVDGTPVYDVKPYLPWAESRTDATTGWAGGEPFTREPEAVVIPQALANAMGETVTALVRRILQLELQPAYQNDPERIYGMTVAGWNVRWNSGANSTLVVCEATRR
jgi:hypothetical protein